MGAGMPRTRFIPITPETLTWAIRESGWHREELVERLGVTSEVLRSWEDGTAQPNLTQFRTIANTLKRPAALFLLPEPPSLLGPIVEFRHPPDVGRAALVPDELTKLRTTTRLQRTASWISRELRHDAVRLPHVRIASDSEQAAGAARIVLAIDVAEQAAWKSSSLAFAAWRTATHRLGVLVFCLPLGRDACRGFSVWDDQAPVIVVNTWWNVEARIFTLFHEYGHLLTRTNSACIRSAAQLRLDGGDLAERWCERFAAALLLPWGPVEQFLTRQMGWQPGRMLRTLDELRTLARRFRVSLRAAALRLIEKEVATWDLYGAIPEWSDQKPAAGGGGGRPRLAIREDEWGARATSLFIAALDEGLMSRADVLSHLDVADTDLDTMARFPSSS